MRGCRRRSPRPATPTRSEAGKSCTCKRSRAPTGAPIWTSWSDRAEIRYPVNRTDPADTHLANTYLSDMEPSDAVLLRSLESAAPQAVSGRALDRLAMAHDASHYLLTPRAVVTPTTAAQVAALLRGSAKS